MKFILIEVDYFIYFFKGVVLSKLGRKEESIKDLTKAIDINPQYANAYYYRG